MTTKSVDETLRQLYLPLYRLVGWSSTAREAYRWYVELWLGYELDPISAPADLVHVRRSVGITSHDCRPVRGAPFRAERVSRPAPLAERGAWTAVSERRERHRPPASRR